MSVASSFTGSRSSRKEQLVLASSNTPAKIFVVDPVLLAQPLSWASSIRTAIRTAIVGSFFALIDVWNNIEQEYQPT